MRLGRTVFLIVMGDKPGHYHPDTLYAPVIICDSKKVAQWETDWSAMGRTVYEHPSASPSCGWLMVRWKGFDIDYGHIVRGITLPDGSKGAFRHSRDEEPWTLIPGALWYSLAPCPAWLKELGCVEPNEEWQEKIALTMRDYCDYDYRKVADALEAARSSHHGGER